MGIAEQMGLIGDELQIDAQGPDQWEPAMASAKSHFRERATKTEDRLKQASMVVKNLNKLPKEVDKLVLNELDLQMAIMLKELAHDCIQLATNHEMASMGYQP